MRLSFPVFIFLGLIVGSCTVQPHAQVDHVLPDDEICRSKAAIQTGMNYKQCREYVQRVEMGLPPPYGPVYAPVTRTIICRDTHWGRQCSSW